MIPLSGCVLTLYVASHLLSSCIIYPYTMFLVCRKGFLAVPKSFSSSPHQWWWLFPNEPCNNYLLVVIFHSTSEIILEVVIIEQSVLLALTAVIRHNKPQVPFACWLLFLTDLTSLETVLSRFSPHNFFCLATFVSLLVVTRLCNLVRTWLCTIIFSSVVSPVKSCFPSKGCLSPH